MQATKESLITFRTHAASPVGQKHGESIPTGRAGS